MVEKEQVVTEPYGVVDLLRLTTKGENLYLSVSALVDRPRARPRVAVVTGIEPSGRPRYRYLSPAPADPYRFSIGDLPEGTILYLRVPVGRRGNFDEYYVMLEEVWSDYIILRQLEEDEVLRLLSGERPEQYRWQSVRFQRGRTGVWVPMLQEGAVVDVARVRGPIWWAQLHRWAQQVFEECPTCGRMAIQFAEGIHDIVNVHLGKPVHRPESLQALAYLAHEAVHKAELPCPVCDPSIVEVAQDRWEAWDPGVAGAVLEAMDLLGPAMPGETMWRG